MLRVTMKLIRAWLNFQKARIRRWYNEKTGKNGCNE